MFLIEYETNRFNKFVQILDSEDIVPESEQLVYTFLLNDVNFLNFSIEGNTPSENG